MDEPSTSASSSAVESAFQSNYDYDSESERELQPPSSKRKFRGSAVLLVCNFPSACLPHFGGNLTHFCLLSPSNQVYGLDRSAVGSDSERLTFLKEVARSQEWLVL